MMFLIRKKFYFEHLKSWKKRKAFSLTIHFFLLPLQRSYTAHLFIVYEAHIIVCPIVISVNDCGGTGDYAAAQAAVEE